MLFLEIAKVCPSLCYFYLNFYYHEEHEGLEESGVFA